MKNVKGPLTERAFLLALFLSPKPSLPLRSKAGCACFLLLNPAPAKVGGYAGG
jgi:hypothetical protein